jgi:hypothetical protein
MELSKGGAAYVWMCTTLMPCVVGKKIWGKRRLKEPLSDIVTCSDETFVLLVLDNNYTRWIAEGAWLVNNQDKEPDMREPKELPESKYTNSGRSKSNGRSKRLSGWSRDGYIMFNTLYARVAEDRLRRANFESELMITMRKACPLKQSKPVETEEDVELFPANDLEGLVAPVNHGAIKTGLPKRSMDDDNSEDDDGSDQYDPNLD